MENAKQIIKEVTKGVKQKSASRKDEITIMKAIMNDTDYSVNIYNGKDDIKTHYPSRDLRKVVTNAVSSITKIPTKEAEELVNSYEFTKSDAQALINLSKEFVHTYLQTGRKLPLGGREVSDIQLMWKNIPAREAKIPTGIVSKKENNIIPEHGGIRAINKCPNWVK